MKKKRPLLIGAVIVAATLLLASTVANAQQITTNNTTGIVTALGSHLTPSAGETTCTMSPALAGTVAADQPNGGLVVQQFSPVPCTAATVIATPPPATPTALPLAPALAINANAGTGASISFVAGSTLRAGGISWTAGPSPAAGTQFVVTFPSAFPVVPAIPCVAANRSAAHINLYSIPTTTTVTVGSDVAPTNGTTYVCQYAVVLP